MMFKDNLVALRKKAGVSQEQLANELGISRQSVSKYELGTAEPDLTRLHLLKEFFGVSYDALLGDDGEVGAKVANAASGWITIQSAVDGAVAQLGSFRVATTSGFGHKKAQAAILGYSATAGSLFGKETFLLGYYATKQDADKEIAAIQVAIQQGVATYRLKYCLQNVKAGLFGVSIE